MVRSRGWSLLGAAMAFIVASSCSSAGEVAVQGITTLSASTSTSITPQSTTLPPPTTQASSTTSSATAPTTTLAPPVASAPYEPPDSEVLRERKRLGGRFAQALLTYGPEDSVATQLASLAEDFSFEPAGDTADLLAEAMVPGTTNVGTVRYVQMGGNREDRASLMVWVDQERMNAQGQRISESRIVDVRIQRVDDAWAVSRLASVGGPRVNRPADLSDLATSVVDHAGIVMPDSARWDIYAGHTTDEMLDRMLEIAEVTDYSVLVLSRGHPYRVFATDKVSRHSVGQAMDVFAVGGQLVVDSRYEGSPSWTLSRKLFDDGIGSIGSPWAFDGFGGRSFTDDVHQDHLHITSL